MAGFYTAALSKTPALHWPGLSPPCTVEDIAANFHEVSELRDFSLPAHNYDEFTIAAKVARARGIHS